MQWIGNELPPKYQVDPRKWTREANALKKRPGAWAEIKNTRSNSIAHSMAYQIRTGGLAAFRGGVYESAARGTRVFARYIGEGEVAE